MAAIALVSTASGLVVAAESERRAGIRGIVQEPGLPGQRPPPPAAAPCSGF
jgi:hypothetical protein